MLPVRVAALFIPKSSLAMGRRYCAASRCRALSDLPNRCGRGPPQPRSPPCVRTRNSSSLVSKGGECHEQAVQQVQRGNVANRS